MDAAGIETARCRSEQHGQIARHFPEFFENYRVLELAHVRITGSAKCNSADVALNSR
jgi:hypothetical protein